MVTQEQIRELPRKYAVGKRPLSRILGWGELTYTRLLEGSKPTPQHEEELLRALNEPLSFLLLLDHAHDAGAISDLTYTRSKTAVQRYLGEDDGADDKARAHAVAQRLCWLAQGELTPSALQLLMFLAQEKAAGQGASLVGLAPREGEWGPEYPDIAQWFTFDHIQAAGRGRRAEEDELLREDDRAIVDATFAEFGMYSALKLREIAGAAGDAPMESPVAAKAASRRAAVGDVADASDPTAHDLDAHGGPTGAAGESAEAEVSYSFVEGYGRDREDEPQASASAQEAAQGKKPGKKKDRKQDKKASKKAGKKKKGKKD